MLSDLSRPLREEEKQAWQRLIRVLGHELNNSLAPIKSIAESLEQIIRRDERPTDWEDDLRRGLAVIGSRAEALTRFLNAYSRLARLPAPQLRSVDVQTLVARVAGLETRLAVKVNAGPNAVVSADPDQIEQLLINLVRNAADASSETNGSVVIGWCLNGASYVEIFVEDEGPGLVGHCQPVRSVLYDKAEWHGNWTSAESSNRRRPSRHPEPGKSQTRSWRPRRASPSRLEGGKCMRFTRTGEHCAC